MGRTPDERKRTRSKERKRRGQRRRATRDDAHAAASQRAGRDARKRRVVIESGIGQTLGKAPKAAASPARRPSAMKSRKKPNTRREHQERNVAGKRSGARVTKAGRRQKSPRNVRQTAGTVVAAQGVRE